MENLRTQARDFTGLVQIKREICLSSMGCCHSVNFMVMTVYKETPGKGRLIHKCQEQPYCAETACERPTKNCNLCLFPLRQSQVLIVLNLAPTSKIFTAVYTERDTHKRTLQIYTYGNTQIYIHKNSYLNIYVCKHTQNKLYYENWQK